MSCKYILLFFFIATSNLFAQSQDHRIVKGRVVDSVFLMPVEGVLVSFYQNDTLINTQASDDEGLFSLLIGSRVTSGRMKFSHINYSTKIFSVKPASGVMILDSIKLKQNFVVLKEVNIVSKSKGITLTNNRDTLEADFSDEHFEKYFMIEKALALVPGLKILDSKFYFNGEEINDVKVDGTNFIFDNEFLLKNVPGMVIKKAQIITKADGISGKKRLNLVLKDDSKEAYIVDFLAAKGTKSSNWGALTLTKLDSLFKIGFRMQSNNINQYLNTWDASTANRINNSALGKNVRRIIELSSQYIFNQRTSLNFDYKYLNQESRNEQQSIIIDLIDGEKQKQTNLNSVYELNRLSHDLNITLNSKLDSITNFTINAKGRTFSSSSKSEATFIYNNIEAEKSNLLASNRLYSGNEIEFVTSYDKLRRSDKTSFSNTTFILSYSNGIDRDTLENPVGNQFLDKVNDNLKLKLDNNFNFKINNNSALQSYFNGNFNRQSSRMFGIANNIKTYDNALGLKYYLNKGKIIYSVDASVFHYLLNYTDNESYNVLGIVSKMSFDYAFKANQKVSLTFKHIYNLPSIMQITGVETVGEQQILKINPNFALLPERVSDLNIKYNFKDLVNLDLGSSYSSNKIESYINNNLEFPVIQYINVDNSTSVYIDLKISKFFLQKKMYLEQSLRGNYSRYHFYSKEVLALNSVIFVTYNLSSKYRINKKLRIGALFDASRASYLNKDIMRVFSWKSQLNVDYDMGKDLSFFLEGQLSDKNVSYNGSKILSVLNFVLTKNVLKNKNLAIFFQANNVFDSRALQILYSDANKLQYSNLVSMGRYFLLGINYKFNTFK